MAALCKRHGRIGEDAVAERYITHGYTLTARNVHESHNELDLILEDDTTLVFVEVKTRTMTPGMASRYGRPSRAVNAGKRQRTVLAAEAWLRAHPTTKQPRIDVAEVYLTHTADGQIDIADIVIFRNAFGAR